MTREEFQEELEQIDERMEELEKEKYRMEGERRRLIRQAQQAGLIDERGRFTQEPSEDTKPPQTQ